MFYGVMTISTDNNTIVEKNSVAEAYNYHVLVTNLNEDQMITVKTNGGAAFTNDIYFKVIDNGITEYTNYNGDKRYDMYLEFTGESLNESYKRFEEDYVNKALYDQMTDKFYVYKSPLMNVSANILANNAVYYVLSVVLLALGIFLMMMLYNIRVNQYKFTYGVYMTFGADFKMLFNTAFWEMFVIMAAHLHPVRDTVHSARIYNVRALRLCVHIQCARVPEGVRVLAYRRHGRRVLPYESHGCAYAYDAYRDAG